MSSGARLGSDPLARRPGPGRDPSASPDPGPGRVLRHILEHPARDARNPSPEERETLYREVAGKFSGAMESLSRMAATAGVWAWGAQPGEGDSLLFMRLLACFVATPLDEGVDVGAFLREVADLWQHLEPRLVVGDERVLLSLERGFSLALGLQAAMETLRPPRAPGDAPVTLALDAARSGRPRVRLTGPRQRFQDEAPCAPEGDLSDLALDGELCVTQAVGPAWIEIAIIP